MPFSTSPGPNSYQCLKCPHTAAYIQLYQHPTQVKNIYRLHLSLPYSVLAFTFASAKVLLFFDIYKKICTLDADSLSYKRFL